jgi:hypothetical protein
VNGFVISQEEEIIEEEEVAEEVELQQINLSQLAKLMQTDEKEVILSDYEIISTEADRDLMVDKVFFSLFEISPNGTFAKKLSFYNCTFKLTGNAPLIFKDWEILKFNIVGCEFISPVGFEDILLIGKYPVLIENCIFHDDIKFLNPDDGTGKLKFRNNEFMAALLIDMSLESLKIDKCTFIADSELYQSRDEEKTHYQLTIGELAIEKVEFMSNVFDNKGLSNLYSINLESTSIGELKMIKNHMQTLNLSSAEVEKTLLIDSLFVDDYIGILNFDFPEANTNVSWYNLGGEKFSIFYTEESDLIIPYQAKTDEQLTDNLKYNDLMSAYNKFNSLFHDRGDISSANKSYVEIKNIETRRQAFIQKINPSLNNLINYKLNVFLRFFSDYATNPGKSLKQSLWFLLAFTILYMFTFSKWDGMNYGFYVEQFNRFSEYIISDKPIKKVYTKKESPIHKDLAKFQEKYLLKGKDVPRLLKLFGVPLHFLGKFRETMIPSLIRFFNFQPKKWSKLNTGEKIWSGFLILVISFLFSIYVLVVKFFNSLIMSLNSFVVIGFGALPEEDEKIAMYLSIIEGIIGWFLLTIFTITLLSQVLQGA